MQYNSHLENSQRPYLDPRGRIRCVSCHSLMVVDQFCEDCGRVQDFDQLGSPFGDKSFTNIFENYWENTYPIVQLYPFLEIRSGKAYRKYIRAIKRRYLLVITALLSLEFSEFRNELSHGPYLIELKDLINELDRHKVDLNEFLAPLLNSQNSPMFHLISPWILSIETKRNNRKSFVKSISDFVFWGLSLRVILSAGFFVIFLYYFNMSLYHFYFR